MNNSQFNAQRPYVAPATWMHNIGLESSICAGSVHPSVTSPGAKTDAQEVNLEFSDANNFANDGWD